MLYLPRRWIVTGILLLSVHISSLFAQSLSLSDSTNTRLVEAVVLNYDKDPSYVQKIVDTASKYSYQDFPRKEDIIAIIAVESRFEEKSQYKGSLGLMQINKSANKRLIEGDLFNYEENIRIGSIILRTYYLALGHSANAAVMAYNAGLGAYQKGVRKTGYLKKYLKNLTLVTNPNE